jgi:DNA-binding transcriptional LysR family regulator
MGSISRSAEKNNISHSAISQAIKSLESELKIDLIHHGRRQFQLTSVGEASIPYLENLLGHLATVKSTLRNTHETPIGELVIWAPQSLIVDSLIEVIARYRQKYPGVTLKVHTGAAYLVQQNVANRNCHLGLAINDHKQNGFARLQISTGDFLLVSKNAKIKWNEDDILATHPDKIEVQHLQDQIRQATGGKLKLKTFLMSWGLLREFTLRGHGTAYLPEYVVKKELKTKQLFKVKQPGQAFRYEVNVIWNPDSPLSRNAELFLSELGLRRGGI